MIARQGLELVVAAILTALVGILWLFPAFWLAFYMLGCFFYPKRVCWWPRCRKEQEDGRGNLRDYTCPLCKNSRRRVRWGARILGYRIED